jgi:hypothetical protein
MSEAFSVWAGFMVRVKVRVRVACRSSGAESELFSVWTGFTVGTGEKVDTRNEWHSSYTPARLK